MPSSEAAITYPAKIDTVLTGEMILRTMSGESENYVGLERFLREYREPPS